RRRFVERADQWRGDRRAWQHHVASRYLRPAKRFCFRRSRAGRGASDSPGVEYGAGTGWHNGRALPRLDVSAATGNEYGTSWWGAAVSRAWNVLWEKLEGEDLRNAAGSANGAFQIIASFLSLLPIPGFVKDKR